MSYVYVKGFGGHAQSEALPKALPSKGNSPQKCPYGLYAEQLSGTAFTVTRSKNQRSWLYRIRPSVMHSPFEPYHRDDGEAGRLVADFEPKGSSNSGGDSGGGDSDGGSRIQVTPNQLRWAPLPLPKEGQKVDFLEGLVTMAGAGSPGLKEGLAIHMYSINADMPKNRCMYNSDGDFLIVPQLGTLRIRTEFGYLEVPPKHVAVLQRGIKFQVSIVSSADEENDNNSLNGNNGDDGGYSEGGGGAARGYVLEVFKGHFTLPDLGPIGANGLASERDFWCPVANYDFEKAEAEQPVDGNDGGSATSSTPFEVINKFRGELFISRKAHTPFDVVAWHGNYVPYQYDLEAFCVINSVSFDHPDPSIFTVLTCPSNEPGVAVADFVVFPPRWMVAEDTFRPPYFHRNCMTEFMGMIHGQYDAKEGFVAGGASLHSCMTAHGPDSATVTKATTADLRPLKFDAGLAFMFETTYMLNLTEYALNAPHLETTYSECWQDMPVTFDPTKR